MEPSSVTVGQHELFEMPEYEILLVPQEFVDRAWDKLFPLIAFGLDYGCGEFDEKSLREACQEGRMFLWAVMGTDRVFYAAAISELAIYPRAVHYWVTLLGGQRMLEWREKLQDALERHAIQCGATWIRCNCRPGMQRMLAPLGYQHRYMSLGKQIYRGEA